MYETDLLGHAQAYRQRAEFLRREKTQAGKLDPETAARLDRQIAANELLAAAAEEGYRSINGHETTTFVAAPPVHPKKAP